MNLLRFRETYFNRIWGGDKLKHLYDKPLPSATIGEAWLISDHDVCESAVMEGPHKGTTLRQLLQEDAPAVLGRRPALTVHGLFPLLLKILDAADVLSVQVHPDDACAARLGEPDVGKTEMWHVLQADAGSELICGLAPEMTKPRFTQAVEDGSIEHHLLRFPVKAGDSLFVEAGIVHAIGRGLVLAEIQQNSDLTYRIYDWGRTGDDGKPRPLHLDKAVEAIHFGRPMPGPRPPLYMEGGDARRDFLAACSHFAAESVTLNGIYRRHIDGETFHILLAQEGLVSFNDGEEACRLYPGQALLVPGSRAHYEASGKGRFLDYYVADMRKDIIVPLLDHGYSAPDLQRSGLSAG